MKYLLHGLFGRKKAKKPEQQCHPEPYPDMLHHTFTYTLEREPVSSEDQIYSNEVGNLQSQIRTLTARIAELTEQRLDSIICPRPMFRLEKGWYIHLTGYQVVDGRVVLSGDFLMESGSGGANYSGVPDGTLGQYRIVMPLGKFSDTDFWTPNDVSAEVRDIASKTAESGIEGMWARLAGLKYGKEGM